MQSRSGILTAGEVTTVTIDTDPAVRLMLEVLNRTGADEISFTIDGSDPTVGGDDTYTLPAAIGGIIVELGYVDTVQVKLISASAGGYTVTVT